MVVEVVVVVVVVVVAVAVVVAVVVAPRSNVNQVSTREGECQQLDAEEDSSQCAEVHGLYEKHIMKKMLENLLNLV